MWPYFVYIPVAADAAAQLFAVVGLRSVHPEDGTVSLAVQLVEETVEVLLVDTAEEDRDWKWMQVGVLRRRRTQADCHRESLDCP